MSSSRPSVSTALTTYALHLTNFIENVNIYSDNLKDGITFEKKYIQLFKGSGPNETKHITDINFKYILFNENVWMLISLKCVQ